MPSFTSVNAKMQNVGAVPCMKYEPRSSKGADDLENPVDMLMKIKCRKAREIAHYYYDPHNYQQRLSCMKVIQQMLAGRDELLGSNAIMVAIQKAAVAEAVASQLVGQTVNYAVLTGRSVEAFDIVNNEVAIKLTEAIKDMMQDDE